VALGEVPMGCGGGIRRMIMLMKAEAAKMMFRKIEAVRRY
jgi:hypothetical protein